MVQDSTFQVARQQMVEQYAAAVSNPGSALFCAVLDSSCSESCLQAIDKTADAMGYGAGNVVRVTIDAPERPLDPPSLFELVEGLDPVCCCAVGKAAVDMLTAAYRIPVQACARTTALGRPVCLLAEMPTMLLSEEGRQKAWSLLKSLPVFPA